MGSPGGPDEGYQNQNQDQEKTDTDSHSILFSLLTNTSPSSSRSDTNTNNVTSFGGGLDPDPNNNTNGGNLNLNVRKKESVNWRTRPSWEIYCRDQQRNYLPKFELPMKRFQTDVHLNNLVGLSLPGDNCIAKFDVDAIVNPTTEFYIGFSGASKCIHEGAGLRLKNCCDTLPPLSIGEALITEGFDLPAKFIIHVNGPYMCDLGWEQNLANCYQKSLQILVENGLRTIAFPCISTGGKKLDPNLAAMTCLQTVRMFLQYNRNSIDRVIFSLHNDNSLDIYRRLMQIYFPVDPG